MILTYISRGLLAFSAVIFFLFFIIILPLMILLSLALREDFEFFEIKILVRELFKSPYYILKGRL